MENQSLERMALPSISGVRVDIEIGVGDMGVVIPNTDPRIKRDAILSITDTKERNRQIALWACTFGFNEILPMQSPAIVPLDLAEVRRKAQRKKEQGLELDIDPSFWNKPDVHVFVEDKWKAESHNKSSLLWLKQIKSWLDINRDLDYIVKINNKIGEFVSAIGKQQNKYKSLEVAL